MRSSRIALVIAAGAIGAAAIGIWLFPRAMPIVALEQSLTRDVALSRADSFFRAHRMAPPDARTAVRFHGSDSLRTFVELAGGGHDSLNALVRGRDVAPFVWTVRAFAPNNPREARVDFAPDGRIIGFEHKLAEADTRPAISADSGRRLAELTLGGWIDDRANRWKLVTSSYETRKTSGRVDRSYTFQRVDRTVGGAPIRADVVIGGDAPIKLRSYVEIPQSFQRTYSEMRSANELLSLIASLGILGVAIAGIVFLSRGARGKHVRWHEPMFVATVIGVLSLAAGLNEMPGSWFSYDTAMSPVAYQALIALGAMATAALTALLTGFTLAAAEVATRQAFPWHLDWWKLWKYRGTKEVAARVAGGYAASCIAFAYVAVFYLVTRTLLGWWVPSEVLDDPNLIASPLPWMSGIAMSLNAGVWEESLFRALPLSLLSLWLGQRPNRRAWLVAGVIGSALIFGFAHSDYASWPPYSRGVEIFLDACFWGVLFLNFGILVTVIAHFVYDLVLFGLFAASGSAPEYRISAAIIVLALLSPALSVLWKAVRQRGLTVAPDDARFSAWTPSAVVETVADTVTVVSHVLTTRARQLVMAAVVVGMVVAVARPPKPTLGPQFTADRARVVSVTDSVLRSRGGNPASWKKLTNVATDTLAAWSRFLHENNIEPEAQRIASTYHPPAWWVVRYVHTAGTAEDRAEEWRVRLWPDGRPLDARHIIPDSAKRGAADSVALRRIALDALASAGVNVNALREAEVKSTARPARVDATVSYTDTSVKLPGGAVARAWVQIAGDEPLVARRGVELPESFLRADREKQTNRTLIAGLAGLLLMGGIITGALLVIRRRAVVLHDGVWSRRQTLAFLGVVAVLAALARLQSLPTALFSYDTSEPWSRFVGTTMLGFVAVVPIALLVLGVWLTLGAMRRRVGVPLLPASEASRGDMLVSGLGLGALVYAAAHLDSLIPSTGLPRIPTTTLDQLVPMFGGAAGIPAAALTMASFAAIPVLVVVGVATRWSVRLVIAAAMVALIGVLAVNLAPPSESNPVRLAGFVVGVFFVVAAVRAWGTSSALSWIVAALAFQGLNGLRLAVYAPTVPEKVAGALTLIVSAALVAAGSRALSIGGAPSAASTDLAHGA